MDNCKDDSFYLEKIKQDICFIVKHMREKELPDLENDEVLLDSMLFRMIQISENAKKLTDAYRKEHKAVPWNAVTGLRNRIVHDYGSVDLDIIFDTLNKDIPQLLNCLIDIE